MPFVLAVTYSESLPTCFTSAGQGISDSVLFIVSSSCGLPAITFTRTK